MKYFTILAMLLAWSLFANSGHQPYAVNPGEVSCPADTLRIPVPTPDASPVSSDDIFGEIISPLKCLQPVI